MSSRRRLLSPADALSAFPLLTKVTPMTTQPTQQLVKLSSLKADRNKEREGDWIEAADIGKGVAFLVRSTNYAPFRFARDARFAKLARKHGADEIPDDDRAKALGELAVEHLLLGWKGFGEDDGSEIAFSPEKAEEILTDEAFRGLRGSVYLAAMKVGQSEVEFVEGAIKN